MRLRQLALAAAFAIGFASAAAATPLAPSASGIAGDSAVTLVRHRGWDHRAWRGRGHHYGWYRHHPRHYGWYKRGRHRGVYWR